jgi:hypothetical protein
MKTHNEILLELKNLVLWASSEINGFAGKDGKRFWSIGVLKKAKTGFFTLN